MEQNNLLIRDHFKVVNTLTYYDVLAFVEFVKMNYIKLTYISVTN